MVSPCQVLGTHWEPCTCPGWGMGFQESPGLEEYDAPFPRCRQRPASNRKPRIRAEVCEGAWLEPQTEARAGSLLSYVTNMCRVSFSESPSGSIPSDPALPGSDLPGTQLPGPSQAPSI